jgi:hypothetical protein
MQTDPDLSVHLKSYINMLDEEYERDTPPELRAEARREYHFAQPVIKTIVQSRETITDAKLKSIEELVQSIPDAVQSLLDDHFTR